MHTRRARRPRRIPLTITLDPADFKFIESCVQLKAFKSIDDLFDASLSFYQRHLEALKAYAEDLSDKGYSRAEILESIEFETLVTKSLAPHRRKRGHRTARRRERH